MNTKKAPSAQTHTRSNEPVYPSNRGVLQALKNEAHQFSRELIEQITGQPTNSSGQKGELRPGETVNLQEQNNRLAYHREATIRYYQEQLEQERLLRRQEKQEVQVRIQALKEEVTKIAQGTKELQKETTAVIIQETPNPGQYHLNFLESLLQFLMKLRQRIEEGNTWLATFNGRSKKRGHFWNQVKKSGTKFLLSSDRTPATQTG